MGKKIKFLPSNGAKEFLSSEFQTKLQHNGIFHRLSSPHVPQQNGSTKQEYQHVVDMGLTLLCHASLPSSFLDYAFETTVYLINRLPTKPIGYKTPFEVIYGNPPDYSSL